MIMSELTLEAKTFLLYYDSSFQPHDFFSFDFRKLQRKLRKFPDFSPETLTPLSQNNIQLTTEILKVWIPPVSSLINELLLTPNILEFDSFFKNALFYIEVEKKTIGFIELFHSDPEISQNRQQCLARLLKFLGNLNTLRTLLLTKEDETVNYRLCISEIYGFSLDLFHSFKEVSHLLDRVENAYFQRIIIFLKKYNYNDSLSLGMRHSGVTLGEMGESYEEIDSRFKEAYNSAPQFTGVNLQLSYMTALEKKSELGYNLDINTSSMRASMQRKSELEGPMVPSPGNTSRRQRTLSRISQKIREKSLHCSPFKKISGEDILPQEKEQRIIFLTEAQLMEKEINQKNEKLNRLPPTFINKYNSKKLNISESEKDKLKIFNESTVLGSVNFDEVKYDLTVDLSVTRERRGMTKYAKNTSNMLKFQEKFQINKLQTEDELGTPSTSLYDSTSLDSNHKDNLISNRGSLLMARRNSKKMPSKIIKDAYEQMRETQKKNQTLLKTFKKSKEKNKIKQKKKDAAISIIKINGVEFQEAEDIWGKDKNKYDALTPEFIKDVDEEEVPTGSSTSSEDDDNEKEKNAVLERKSFLNNLFHGAKPRLTLKRHSKILSGKDGRIDDKTRKVTEKKKNLFQNWHMAEDVETLVNVSAFNIKTSRESVNYFIIKYLINMKLKSHEYNSQLKLIRERWNKIKFAFQMFLLYRKLHEKRTISFFDEAHIIVQEMRQTSLLREFDQFLYLVEMDVQEFLEIRNKTIDGREEFTRKRARSKSKNINQVLVVRTEKVVENVLILERSMKRFSPNRYLNYGTKFCVFDSKTIHDQIYEKLHPDLVLL